MFRSYSLFVYNLYNSLFKTLKARDIFNPCGKDVLTGSLCLSLLWEFPLQYMGAHSSDDIIIAPPKRIAVGMCLAFVKEPYKQTPVASVQEPYKWHEYTSKPSWVFFIRCKY